jgi:hypothetical protein
MRYPIYISLFLYILTSCSNDKVITAEYVEKPIDSLKQNFIPILNGVWVLTDYINAIEQTLSPLKAADKFQGVVTMIIDVGGKSDSIEIHASWNNHEGYSFTTYFLAGQTQNSLKTNMPSYNEKNNYYELGYETINNETFLILYHYNSDNQIVDRQKYTKVLEKQQEKDVAWGLQYIVNKILFSGNYLLIDSTNFSTKVNLKSDGSLTGYSEFKTYYVSTDFMGGPKTNLDELAFNLHDEKIKWFAFTISRDTIYVYNTKGDEEAGELLELDKVQYKLVRQ